jgi:GAF domain-containing protein
MEDGFPAAAGPHPAAIETSVGSLRRAFSSWARSEERPTMALSNAFVQAAESNNTQLSSPISQIVQGACESISSVDYASIMLRVAEQYRTIACTHPELLDLEAHYATDDGPTVQAVLNRRISRIASTARQAEWPTFRRACQKRGIMSVASFPIEVEGEVRGALNLYSADHHAFGQEETRAGRAFAQQAGEQLVWAGDAVARLAE